MKPYKRILVKFPLAGEDKAGIRAYFAPSRVRIGDISRADSYSDGPECLDTVEFDVADLPDEAPEPTKSPEPKEPAKESESEQSQDVPTNTATNKNGQTLELVTAFTEKFGKPPHHKAKDASIEEALTNEA